MNRRGRWMSLYVAATVLLVSCARSRPGEHEATRVGLPPVSTTEDGYVYTADERAHSISVVDVRGGTVRTVPVSIAPHNVQISRDGAQLLAIGASAAGEQAAAPRAGQAMEDMAMERGRLLVFSTAGPDLKQIADIEVGRHPAHVIVDSAARLAYATSSGENAVYVVDLVRKRIMRRIPTGAFPHGLRMSPDEREIYVACVDSNSVSVIDVAQAKEVARIPVGKAPVQVGFLPDTTRCYVSLRDENAVAAIDTHARRRTTTIAVGRSPIQVFATPDGRWVYVANQGTEAQPDDTASVIDTRTNRVAATLKTGKGCHGVVVSDDGQRAFTANSFENTVSVIDTMARKVLRNVSVGAGPGGITFRRAPPHT